MLKAAVILMLAAGGAAAEGGVATAPSLEAALDAAGTAAPLACAMPVGGPPEGRLWLRRGPGGLSITAEPGVSPEALGFWTEAALGAREAAAALYGAEGAGDLAVMIESVGGRVSLFDGRATTAHDPCAALERLAAAIAGAPPPSAGPVPPETPAAPTGEGPTLSPGRSARVALAGASGLAPADLSLRGPEGVAAEVVAVGEDGAAEAAVTVAPGAPAGSGMLRLYRRSDPFRPLAETPVRVAPAGGAPAASPARLAPGGEARGLVGVGASAEVALTIAAEGGYRLRSTGEADLSARLIGPDGAVVAADDDGGEGYGFALEARLAPGEYRLELRHCCGGGGLFKVVAEEN